MAPVIETSKAEIHADMYVGTPLWANRYISNGRQQLHGI